MPGGFYHVMNRGAGRRAVFIDRPDHQFFLKLLGDISEKRHIRIHAYCLMGNHYHLLLETPEPNLSRSMQYLNSTYTQVFNKRHERDGALFKGRYRSILVERDGYLLDLVRYIHRNPLTAGLVKDLRDYPWSSYPGYMEPRLQPTWLVTELVLSMWGGPAEEARRRHRNGVIEGPPAELVKVLASARVPAILGSKSFRKQHLTSLAVEVEREIPEAVRRRQAHLMQSLERMICDRFSISEEELKERGNRVRQAQSVFVVCARSAGLTLPQIGNLLARSPSTIASTYRRTLEQMREDAGLARQVSEINNALSED